MTPTRTLALSLLVSVVVLSCGDDSGPANAGDGGVGDAGSSGGAPIPFCAALNVIRGKCQRCHQTPPRDGAPVPFLTYADTQAQYYMTDKKWSDTMLAAVGKDFMPDVSQNEPPTNRTPPVEPLTASEKATLMGWLQQGAKPEGGANCP